MNKRIVIAMLPAIVVLLAVMSLAFFSDPQMASASPGGYKPPMLNGIAITNTSVCDQQYPYQCGTWLTPWSWSLATGGNRMRDYGWNATFATYIPGYASGWLIEVNYTVLSFSPTPHGHFGNSTVHLAYDVGAWKVDGPARLLTLNETATITTTTGSRANQNILFTGSTGLDSVSIRINSITINGVPAYTIYPPTATPIPQGALPCITATVAATPTVGPTQTPILATPTHTPTHTPGAPPLYSPTPTPTLSPTPGTVITNSSFDSGVMHFDNDLDGLSAVGGVNAGGASNFLRWDSAIGQDGESGVAMMHAYMNEVMTTTHPMTIVALFNGSGPTGGFASPVALTWWAKTAYTLTQEETHSMRVWYLDPDYDGAGTQVWVASSPSPPDKYLSNSWRKFGAVITSEGGSGRIAAIGFTDSYLSDHYSTTSPCPSQNGCIYLDDVRITYGAANALQLPTCGTESNPSSPGTHICIINQHTIDVMGTYCQWAEPLGLWDIGGAIRWLSCEVRTYFTILPENSRQTDAIRNYSIGIEPFGTLWETVGGLGYVQQKTVKYAEWYQYQVHNPTDWGKFFQWGNIVRIHLTPPSGTAPYFDATNCKFAAIYPDIPADIINTSCLMEQFTIQSGILGPLQILIDIFCVAAIFSYVRNNWMAGGGGGDE